MATYIINGASENSWWEAPVEIEAASLAEAKERALEMVGGGMDASVAEKGSPVRHVARWIECNDSRYNRYAEWEEIDDSWLMDNA